MYLTDYTLRVMMYLALKHSLGDLATMDEIAGACGISRNHLEKIIHERTRGRLHRDEPRPDQWRLSGTRPGGNFRVLRHRLLWPGDRRRLPARYRPVACEWLEDQRRRGVLVRGVRAICTSILAVPDAPASRRQGGL